MPNWQRRGPVGQQENPVLAEARVKAKNLISDPVEWPVFKDSDVPFTLGQFLAGLVEVRIFITELFAHSDLRRDRIPGIDREKMPRVLGVAKQYRTAKARTLAKQLFPRSAGARIISLEFR